MTGDRLVSAADLAATRDQVLAFLTALADRDWSAPVPDLDWTCETTLRHMITAQSFYSAHLATRTPRRLEVPRGVDAELSIPALLDILFAQVTVLAAVIRDAPPDARSWHNSGMTDPSGYACMGCDELLVHTWDIGRGFGVPFALPAALCGRLVSELFPMWAPIDGDSRDAFLWCNGRIALPDRARMNGDWGWWSRPLAEFDGTDPDA